MLFEHVQYSSNAKLIAVPGMLSKGDESSYICIQVKVMPNNNCMCVYSIFNEIVFLTGLSSFQVNTVLSSRLFRLLKVKNGRLE